MITALAATLIAVAALAAYHNTFTAPFVFDDQFAIVENPSIQHLARLGDVLRPPPYASGAAGRPLVNLTLAINYALGGLDVRGYHAMNLALHIGAALALFGLLRRTLANLAVTSPTLVALTATVAWTVHPLLTESVTCVIQRNEVLAGLCYLLMLYCFARGAETGGAKFWLPLAVLACFLGMASKEIMASAPLIVFLYDRTFVVRTFREAWHRRSRFYLILASSWLLLAALMLTSQHRGGTVGFGLGVTAWDYLLTQCRAIVIYLKLSFWPHPLVIDYGTDIVQSASAVIAPGLGLLVLLAFTIAGIWRRSPLGFLGACFFSILAPSSSIVPLVSQPIAEHRMYLPLVAVVILVVIGLNKIAGTRSLLIWPVIVIGLGVLTFQRNADYQSEVTLTQGALAANPRNDRAYLNLGTFSSRQGQTAEAIGYYKKALAIDPRAADTHYNLAAVLDQAGRADEAIEQYQQAVRLRPDFPTAQYHLGLDLAKSGRMEDALGPLERAVRLQPDSAAARRSLAAVHVQLGDAQAQAGRMVEAIAHYQAALRLEPDQARLQNNLANALSQNGRAAEAIMHYEAALRLQPDYAEAHYNLAIELLQAGRVREARAHFVEELRLRPDDDQTRLILARLGPAEEK
jgi:tetratricopeptide (TPR) repeat protein